MCFCAYVSTCVYAMCRYQIYMVLGLRGCKSLDMGALNQVTSAGRTVSPFNCPGIFPGPEEVLKIKE